MPPFQRQLRVLTLTQPWATLMAYGLKQNETRGWTTSYRGFIAIHSAKTLTPESIAVMSTQPFVDALVECCAIEGKPPQPLPLGVVLAVGCLNGITPTDNYRISPHNREFAFGDYSPGRFVWHFNDMRRLSTPIPARGYQRLWTPDEALHTAILADAHGP